jgi:hypothetical protein
MGKAYKAPPNNYDRVRYVSHHAIQRLRERFPTIESTHAGVGFRSDTDLGNWIDQLTERAIRRGDAQLVIEKKTQSEQKLVKLNTSIAMFAVVDTNDRGDKPEAEAIVTVLTDDMVTRYRECRWDTALGHKPFAVLSALKPQLVRLPSTSKSLEAALAKEGAEAPPDPVRDPSIAITRSGGGIATVLISYSVWDRERRERGDSHYEEYGRADAPGRVVELLARDDIVEGSVRVWGPVPIDIERTVTVKLGGE